MGLNVEIVALLTAALSLQCASEQCECDADHQLTKNCQNIAKMVGPGTVCYGDWRNKYSCATISCLNGTVHTATCRFNSSGWSSVPVCSYDKTIVTTVTSIISSTKEATATTKTYTITESSVTRRESTQDFTQRSRETTEATSSSNDDNASKDEHEKTDNSLALYVSIPMIFVIVACVCLVVIIRLRVCNRKTHEVFDGKKGSKDTNDYYNFENTSTLTRGTTATSLSYSNVTEATYYNQGGVTDQNEASVSNVTTTASQLPSSDLTDAIYYEDVQINQNEVGAPSSVQSASYYNVESMNQNEAGAPSDVKQVAHYNVETINQKEAGAPSDVKQVANYNVEAIYQNEAGISLSESSGYYEETAYPDEKHERNVIVKDSNKDYCVLKIRQDHMYDSLERS